MRNDSYNRDPEIFQMCALFCICETNIYEIKKKLHTLFIVLNCQSPCIQTLISQLFSILMGIRFHICVLFY